MFYVEIIVPPARRYRTSLAMVTRRLQKAMPLSFSFLFSLNPQAERRPPREITLDGLGAGLLFSPRAPSPARRFPCRCHQDLRGGAELHQEGLYRAPGGAGHFVVRGGACACPGGDDLRGVCAGAGEMLLLV